MFVDLCVVHCQNPLWNKENRFNVIFPLWRDICGFVSGTLITYKYRAKNIYESGSLFAINDQDQHLHSKETLVHL